MIHAALKTLIAIALLAALGFLVWSLAAPHVDPQRVAQELRAFAGLWWTPLAYAALYALLAVLFIPPQALSIAAVLLWGWRLGGTIELAAATLSAIPPYILARGAMRPRVEAALERYPIGKRLLREESSSILLVLRLFPAVPYTPLNYLAGLSPLKPLPYAAITFAGMAPSVFLFTWFVDALMEGAIAPRAVMWRIFLAGGLLALMVVAARLAARRLRRAPPSV